AWVIAEHACLAAIAVLFCVLAFQRGLTIPQYNDHESAWTLEEATAVLEGHSNWGMNEYTHHPIGRAYILLPFVWLGGGPLIVVPLAVAVLTSALALLLLLQRASTVVMRGFLVAFFYVLLGQAGFVNWMGNLHQHSYNMSSIMLMVVLCGGLRRVSWPLAATGAVCGWIGYDFFIVQMLAIIALRIAYWARRRGTPFVYAVWAAGSEAAAFAAAFLFSVLLHYGQNVLYFHSAEMAYWDLYGSFGGRVAAGLPERLEKLTSLASLYTAEFFSVGGKWSQPLPLLVVAGLYAVATFHAALAWARLEPRDRASPADIGRLSLALAVCAALALGSVPAWMFIAPRHAEPHLHFFPRLFFVSMIVLVACTVLLASQRDRDGGARRWVARAVPIVLFALAVAANQFIPGWTKAALDARYFDTIWNSPVAAVRADEIAASLLAALPAASSVSPEADINGPLATKSHVALIAGVGVWGLDLDVNPTLRWFPAPGEAFPHWYELQFSQPVRVSDIALRFWGTPMKKAAHTPEQFDLLALAPDGSATVARRFPEQVGELVKQGKYLALHYRFAPPLECQGLRIEFASTVGGKGPVMTDFLAFGTPSSPEAP
ncbi:MAG: hypothetical protein ACRERC_08245, partial [Candidatus Binatia bacterium]